MEDQRDFAALPPHEPAFNEDLSLDEFDSGLRERLNNYNQVDALSQVTNEDERAMFPARVALMFGMHMPPTQAAQFNQDQAVEHLKVHRQQLDEAKAEIAQRPDLPREVYEWFGQVGLA